MAGRFCLLSVFHDDRYVTDGFDRERRNILQPVSQFIQPVQLFPAFGDLLLQDLFLLFQKIMYPVLVAAVDSLTVVHTDLIVQQAAPRGIGEKVTLQLHTDVASA